MLRQNKKLIINVIIAVILLSFAYSLRIVSRKMTDFFLATMLIAIRNIIHVVLVILWSNSVRNRIVNKQVRKLFLIVSILMAACIIIKTIKWEFFPNNTITAVRYLWYCFYIPMIIIPLNGVYITQYIGKPESFRLPKWAYLFYIPALFIIISVLTNDLHNLVFSFPNGIINFDSDYSYEILYWFAMAWYICLGLAFVFLLLKKSRLPGSKKIQKIPLIVMVAAITFWLLYTFGIINGDLTVIDCLFIFVLLETSLQTRLIPTNTRYKELFEKTTVPVVIVDDDFNVCYSSGKKMDVDYNIIKSLNNNSLIIDNTIISSSEIRFGNVIWQDDISKLNEQRDKLNEIKEELAEETELIRAETEIKEKKAQTDEKNFLYDKIAFDVKKQLDSLSYYLDKVEKGEDVRKNLAFVAVIGSYVKRRGNLLLLNNNEIVSSYELESSLKESIENLKLLNINSILQIDKEKLIPLDFAIQVYDFYENVIELLLDSINSLIIKIKINDTNLKLTLQIGVNQLYEQDIFEDIIYNKNINIEIDENDIYIDACFGGEK